MPQTLPNPAVTAARVPDAEFWQTAPRMAGGRLLAIAEACAPVIDTEPDERKRRLWPA